MVMLRLWNEESKATNIELIKKENYLSSFILRSDEP